MISAHTKWRRARTAFGRLLLWLILAGLFVLGAYLFLSARATDPRGCPAGADVLPDVPMFVFGLVALLIGRCSGRIRYRPEWATAGASPGSEVVPIVALGVFLTASCGVLTYEAIGVMLGGGPAVVALEPITYYVRCAIYADTTSHAFPLATYLVIGLVSGLVGHWLWPWYPGEDGGAES